MRSQSVFTAVLSIFVSAASLAQTTSTLPDAPLPQNSKRILYIIPAYDVTSASAPYHSLNAQEKLKLFTKETFDPFTLVEAGADAGIGQGLDRPHYGQGGEAYAKRFGAALADSASADFFSDFAFPALLRQDPRYFQSGTGSGSRRFGYAISRILITRNDSGRNAFNFSEVLGTLAGAGLSNTYYPDRDRTVGYTMGRWGERIAVQAAVNVLKEFWPELRRIIGQ